MNGSGAGTNAQGAWSGGPPAAGREGHSAQAWRAAAHRRPAAAGRRRGAHARGAAAYGKRRGARARTGHVCGCVLC
jgi:hypothetical protein